MFRRYLFIFGMCLIVVALTATAVFYRFRTDIALINIPDMATYDDRGAQKISKDIELGDNYTFYYLYCGTGCRGFRVNDQESGALYNGVISYVYNHKTETDDTVLQDWYGRIYRFEGRLDLTVDYYKGYVIFGFAKTEIVDGKTFVTEKERVMVPIKPPRWSDLWTITTL